MVERRRPQLQALAIGVKDPSTLPMDEVPGNAMPGYDNQKPLFIGHYWMKGRPMFTIGIDRLC